MNPEFWRNKKVFLTGHTGFKGGWLSSLLSHFGASLYGVSLPPPKDSPSLFTAANISSLFERSSFVDIRQEAELTLELQASNPEVVFHLAAQPLVRASYDDPLFTYQTNVIGTANLLEAVRKTQSVKVVVLITTDKVYENKESATGYIETDRLGGSDPYSSSKACAELLVAAYRSSFFSNNSNSRVKLITVRAGNVIGGGDWGVDRLIPDAIRAVQSGNELVIRNPSSVRPWQHVLDPLRGYLMVAERSYRGNENVLAAEWNFGPKDEAQRTVEEVLLALRGEGELPFFWRQDSSEQPHETKMLKIDPSKAERELDWTSLLDFQNSLLWTREWYKSWLTVSGSAAKITTTQIEQFLKLSPRL